MSEVTVTFEVDNKSISEAEVLSFLSSRPDGLSMKECSFSRSKSIESAFESSPKEWIKPSCEEVLPSITEHSFSEHFDDNEDYIVIQEEPVEKSFSQSFNMTKASYSRGDIIEAMPTERKQLHANFFTKLQAGDYGEENILVQQERLTPKARLVYLDEFTLIKVKSALERVVSKHKK